MESESGEVQEAPMCPLLSTVRFHPEAANPPGNRNWYLKKIPCQLFYCAFWNKKAKQCGFVRDIEYESLLEKIIQSKQKIDS